MRFPLRSLPSPLALLLAGASPVLAQEYKLHTFERQRLTDVYYSEGANAGDVNGDGLPDVVVGGMVGGHVLTQRVEKVGKDRWDAARPKPVKSEAARSIRGPQSVLDGKTGRAAGAIEGEDLRVLKASAGKTAVQKMKGFTKDRWSGDAQLFWSGGKAGETLTLELEVTAAGKYDVSAVLTMAGDYATVQLGLGDQPLGEPLDLYHSPDVVTSGVLALGAVELKEGPHHLTIRITGANPAAVPKFLVGLDYLLLKPAK